MRRSREYYIDKFGTEGVKFINFFGRMLIGTTGDLYVYTKRCRSSYHKFHNDFPSFEEYKANYQTIFDMRLKDVPIEQQRLMRIDDKLPFTPLNMRWEKINGVA
jgi:hypothetical protein